MHTIIKCCLLPFVLIVSQDIGAQEAVLNRTPQIGIVTINEKEEIEVVQFFKSISPLKIQRLEQLKMKHLDKYEKNIVNLLKAKRQLDQLKKNNPSEYEERINTLKRENKIDELAKQYRSSTASQEQKNIITQLNPLLEEQFEVREKRRVQQIKKMEENLQKLKQTLEMRKKNKEKIIKNYMDKITNKSDNLEW